jgi:competence ComEA-like helix-hairpin-helix protein
MADASDRRWRQTPDGLRKGDDPGKRPRRLPLRESINHSPRRTDVKKIVTVFLTVLMLSPGILAAAEKKAGQEVPATVAVKAMPQKLDLNRASREELVGVPGIGPRMAQAIVDLRQKKGSFKRVEELLEVTGIKEKKLAAIAGYLEVIPLQASAATAPATTTR